MDLSFMVAQVTHMFIMCSLAELGKVSQEEFAKDDLEAIQGQ